METLKVISLILYMVALGCSVYSKIKGDIDKATNNLVWAVLLWMMFKL